MFSHIIIIILFIIINFLRAPKWVCIVCECGPKHNSVVVCEWFSVYEEFYLEFNRNRTFEWIQENRQNTKCDDKMYTHGWSGNCANEIDKKSSSQVRNVEENVEEVKRVFFRNCNRQYWCVYWWMNSNFSILKKKYELWMFFYSFICTRQIEHTSPSIAKLQKSSRKKYNITKQP